MRGHTFIPEDASSGYLCDKLVHTTDQCTPPSSTHVSTGQSTVGRAKDRVTKPAQVACWSGEGDLGVSDYKCKVKG